MKTTKQFDGSMDRCRYDYDFGLCSASKGFAQVDTGQDASYFGTWANPKTLTVICFCEGDVTIEEAEDNDEFRALLERIRDWNDENGHGFKGIDPMGRPSIEKGFRRLGLGGMLH